MASYGTGDKVVLRSGRKVYIEKVCDDIKGRGQRYSVVCLPSAEPFTVPETAITELISRNLGHITSIKTTEEVAKAIAMLTRLTYTEALEDLNKGIEAMTESDGACQTLFENVRKAESTLASQPIPRVPKKLHQRNYGCLCVSTDTDRFA